MIQLLCYLGNDVMTEIRVCMHIDKDPQVRGAVMFYRRFQTPETERTSLDLFPVCIV